MESSNKIANFEEAKQLKVESVQKGFDPLSLITQTQQQKQPEELKQQLSKGPSPFENPYPDQVRPAKLLKEIESTHILEVGETIVICFDKIKELTRMTDGKIYITNYRILYRDGTNDSNEMFDYNSIPVGYLSKYKFNYDKKSNWLDLTTKDQRVFKFKFENAFSYQRAIDAVSKNCVLNRHKDLFAYGYVKKVNEYNNNQVLHGISEQEVLQVVMKDFLRMKVEEERQRFRKLELPDKTRIRRRMDLPPEIFVPKVLLEDQIFGCASFRINGRCPALAYFDKKLNIALWRGSEPQQEQILKRNMDDENYLKHINIGASNSQKLYIFNQNDKEAKNYPQEEPVKYVNSKLINYCFSDVKKVVSAFEKMWEYSNRYSKSKKKHRFFSKIDKSKWFALIDNIISKAFLVHRAFTQVVSNETRAANILLYCSNGQAGSAILSSLTQIILDPYYRTFEGFKVLILKEWVYFGHNFMKYHNLNNDLPSIAEQSYAPLFVLFLDCVHQLIRMNETQFEFTQDYLVLLAFHSFTNKFFEFTHANPLQQLHQISSETYKEQVQQAVDQTLGLFNQPSLISIFSFFKYDAYRNKLYEPEQEPSKHSLFYQTNLLKYWKGYFGRYQSIFYNQEIPLEYTESYGYEKLKLFNIDQVTQLKQIYQQITSHRENSKMEISNEDLELLMQIEQVLQQVGTQQNK